MKDRIIDATLESLRREGLKFSVDTLAEQLKISKKTVYRIFPDKEVLALAMYEKYYGEVKKKIGEISGDEQTRRNGLLRLYFDVKTMTRKDIFNKYKLNASVYAYTSARNDELWEIIVSSLDSGISEQDAAALRIIVDGSFEKLCDNRLGADKVIERLLKIL